jgi:hypothetical protein
MLQQVEDALSNLVTRIADTRMVLAERARGVTMPVYEIARSIKKPDTGFSNALEPATKYFAVASKNRAKIEKAVQERLQERDETAADTG